MIFNPVFPSLNWRLCFGRAKLLLLIASIFLGIAATDSKARSAISFKCANHTGNSPEVGLTRVCQQDALATLSPGT